MSVAISVACGAATASEPMPNTRCMYSTVMPMTNDEVTTPIAKPIC
jgi:hypothetical protein